MRYFILLLLPFCLLLSPTYSIAQDIPFSERFFPGKQLALRQALIDLQNGDDYFLSGKPNTYKFAIPYYESASKFNNSNASVNYKLGTCYLMARKHELALTHLKKAIELNPEVESEAYYYLGKTYQMKLMWDEAIAQYFHYGDLIRGTEPVENVTRRIEECRNGKELVKNPIHVSIENLGVTINSKGPEYTPLIAADESQLFFTSRRPGSTGNETDFEDLEYYEDIYVSEKINDKWTMAKNLGPTVNTPSHDAGAGLSLDGHILFVFKGKRNNGDILLSYLDKNEWSVPVDPGKNINTKFHESSACLSPDGNKLYFSSDRPGGYGGRDIFMSDWDPIKKTWGPAVNMGGTINTPYDEEGVFMHPSGSTFYFSSKGHNCMGGYDVFYSINLNGIWQKPINIGYPVNTPDDDVYIVVSADGGHAYYTSVTKDSFGETDLYKVTFESDNDKPISKMVVLKGYIKEGRTKKPLAATIDLVDLNKQERIGSFSSETKTGKYLVALPGGKKYGVFFYSNGYLFESANFDIADSITYRETVFDVNMSPVESGNNMVLDNLFFDPGKSEIKKESETTLRNLVRIMKDYPTLTVEISGFTHNEGDEAFSLKLSEERAKNVVDFMVVNNVARDRLTYKGYGDGATQSKKDATDDFTQNRSIEFKINSR